MVPYRIVLADHSAPLREGLKRILKEESNIEVVGEAGNDSDLFKVLRLGKLAPDMIILDASMPNFYGTEAIHKVKAIYPDVKVLVLSMYKDKEYLNQAISNGAEGYLLKETADRELLPAIEMIMEGRLYVPALL